MSRATQTIAEATLNLIEGELGHAINANPERMLHSTIPALPEAPEELHSLIRDVLCGPIGIQQWIQLQALYQQAKAISDEKSRLAAYNGLKEGYVTLPTILLKDTKSYVPGCNVLVMFNENFYINVVFLAFYQGFAIFKKPKFAGKLKVEDILWG